MSLMTWYSWWPGEFPLNRPVLKTVNFSLPNRNRNMFTQRLTHIHNKIIHKSQKVVYLWKAPFWMISPCSPTFSQMLWLPHWTFFWPLNILGRFCFPCQHLFTLSSDVGCYQILICLFNLRYQTPPGDTPQHFTFCSHMWCAGGGSQM